MYSKLVSKNFTRNCSNFSRILNFNAHRNKSCLITQQSFADFENSLSDILNQVPVDIYPPEVLDTLKKITEYSVCGRKIRGTLALFAYDTLEKPENITDKTVNEIQTLAWGAEMVHSYFMILQDIENSDLRNRKKYGWYLHDASLFRSFVYELIKSIFKDTPSYVEFLDLFDKAFLNTAIGYRLDNTKNNYEKFTMELFNSIADYKTSFLTFKFPVFLATKLIENFDEYAYRKLDNIFTDIGRLYQIQKDYFDCYGEVIDQSGMPKYSKDIQEGKCSWLAVAALQRCSPTQRIVFTSCYGSPEPAHIERIKLLYDQLNIPAIYKAQEEKIYNDVKRKADNLNGIKLEPQLFLRILDTIKKGHYED